MDVPKGIRSPDLLSDVFGYWPTFHDAEVVRVSLDRDGDELGPGPCLDAWLYVFEMTREVDQNGLLVLTKRTLVHFRFRGVVELSLEGFNTQNSLWRLTIEDISDRQMEYVHFEVTFSASYGMGADFQCHSVSVESAEPFVPTPQAC